MKRLAPLLLLLVGACGGSGYQYDPYDLSNRYDQESSGVSYAFESDTIDGDFAVATVAAAPESYRGRGSGGQRAERSSAPSAGLPPAPPPAQAMEPAPTLADDQTALASNEEVPSLDRDAERRLPLLIYTGSITLAIYDVEDTKQAAIALIEEFGGYAAQRTNQHIVLRVPAEHFRDALDSLGELGDVLSLTWNAADVGDQFNDLEVRIRNSRQMRARLEELLARAETVSDALAIERELERVTLDIERLEGQLRQMADRIAFSTITIAFSQIPMNAVPGEEYRLPFQWLNQLGVERLLSL